MDLQGRCVHGDHSYEGLLVLGLATESMKATGFSGNIVAFLCDFGARYKCHNLLT